MIQCTSTQRERVREMGGKATGVKATAAQDSQETRGKGDILMCEREMDIMLPGDTTAGLNATEGIRRKSCFKVVMEGVRRRAMVFVGDSIVRMTGRALSKGTTWWFAFQGQK